MKYQIRTSMFETNSSSVHTLVVSKDGMEPCNMKLHRDGKIWVDYGKFDRISNFYNSQYDKLSYLITQCYYLGDMSNPSDNYYFQYIEDAVMDYVPGCKGIKVLGKVEPMIDHQEIPEHGFNLGINEYDNESIQGFIFNKYIGFTTDSD